jgi:hypothetical protein
LTLSYHISILLKEHLQHLLDESFIKIEKKIVDQI